MSKMLCAAMVPVLLAQQPVEVARSRTYTEGPVFDRQGNLFFSHHDGIDKLSPAGEVSAWVRNADARFNGHKVLPDGTHLVCASKKSAVWRLSPNGSYLGEAARAKEPNDLTLDRHGGFYFTDPNGSRKEPVGIVYYVNRQGTTWRAASGMLVPNGLVIDPQAKFLYVSETGPNRILRFAILEPGKLGEMEIFATLPSREGHQAAPDGLAVDGRGNLYVAHLGTGHVLVLDPGGKVIRQLPGGNYDVSNLAFGPNGQLFITGSVGHRSNTEGRVFRLDLAMPAPASPRGRARP